MMEPFKNAYNIEAISQTARLIGAHCKTFDAALFISLATENLDALELKERCWLITEALIQTLPADFEQSVQVLMACLHPLAGEQWLDEQQTDETGIAGWMIMPLSLVIAKQGQAYFELSMQALEAMTQRFTAEFAIRYFWLQQPDAVLKQCQDWCQHPSAHVRRLVSEGLRPRLPWAMQLPDLIANPEPSLPLLKQLRDDDEEYVRRSVANHLNDISKDHAELIAELTAEWLKDADKNRLKLLKHANRSLIKQGHAQTLLNWGYEPLKLPLSFKVLTPDVQLGEHLIAQLEITNNSGQTHALLADIELQLLGARGQARRQIVKWFEGKIKPGQTLLKEKKVPIKKVTTRQYYEGAQGIKVQLNGQCVAEGRFALTIVES